MSPARYFVAEYALPPPDPRKELISSLTRLVRNFPPTSLRPGGGFYHGPTSIALLFFVLSKRYKDLPIDHATLAQWCGAYLEVTESALKAIPPPTPSHNGISSDYLAYLSLMSSLTKSAAAIEQLCESASNMAQLDSNASHEWLYGLAGTLYHLRLVRACLSPTSDPGHYTMIATAADEVIRAILAAGDAQPWSWHGKVYVGAAHGIIGIITQIVLTDPAYANDLEKKLDDLILQTQSEDGNWPSSLPGGKDNLVQFCHGAPGVVNSLLSIRQYFPKLKGKIDEAMTKGRGHIRARGLLVKEPCLCHGICGNGLALQDGPGTGGFEHFMAYATGSSLRMMFEQGAFQQSGHPESLWGGEAGRAWAWAVMDKESGLERRFLGYNEV